MSVLFCSFGCWGLQVQEALGFSIGVQGLWVLGEFSLGIGGHQGSCFLESNGW